MKKEKRKKQKALIVWQKIFHIAIEEFIANIKEFFLMKQYSENQTYFDYLIKWKIHESFRKL